MRRRINSESEIDMERQTQLDIKCLQILRAVIYNEMIQIDVEEKEREPKKYRKYDASILAKQDMCFIISSVHNKT